MAETSNYKLFLTDDSSINFKDWREKINGQSDSNMIKIDTAIYNLAYDTGTALANLSKDLSSVQTIANAAIPKAGGTMTGLLTLSGDPTEDFHAVTKRYLELYISSVLSSFTVPTKVSQLENDKSYVTTTELDEAIYSAIGEAMVGSY